MATWRKLISETLEKNGETWDDIMFNTLTENELDYDFYDGYGGIDGPTFTIWTTNRVYFPACYDGMEWCASVSRHPDGKTTKHIGGG